MAQIKAKKRKSKLFKFFVTIFAVLFALFLWFMYYVIDGIPPLEKLENPVTLLASNVYSEDKELIGQFFIENRIPVKYKEINQSVINALIATEDIKFYRHWGVDVDRFVKALIKTALGNKQGASTITQQLAKNLYALKDYNESSFETIVRKVREWITAVQIEKKYTKIEILEMYLNQSYFGNGAYGISSAASIYFSKKPKDLTIPESAVLVGLLKSSVYYDPVRKYNNSLRRRNLILSRLLETEFITEREFQEYRLMPIKVSLEKLKRRFKSPIAPHFVEYIRQQMEKWAQKNGYNLYTDGLSIYTSLDSRMQKIANAAVKEHFQLFQPEFDKVWNWDRYPEILKNLILKNIKESEVYKKAESEQERHKIISQLRNDPEIVANAKKQGQTVEVGFVAMNPKDGHIKAMVGGRDSISGMGLNHVTQIKRQPGSSFKPIVYLTAIDNGLYPAFPILNEPFLYKDWSPRNFEGDTGGYMTLREGLRLSKNLIAARLIRDGYAHLDKIDKNAKAMGIKNKLDLVPALALGTGELSPLELVNAYATISNKGIHYEPISILEIKDKSGILLESFKNESNEALSEETSYIITNMLETAINQGTGAGARSRYNFRRPAAGKTGTTQNYADAWFMGFTPQLAAGVWVGFDDMRITFGGSYGQGARAAMPVWAIFMRELYKVLEYPVEEFEMPKSKNIETVSFCYDSVFLEGNPRVSHGDCGTVITDIINKKDIPGTPGAIIRRDTRFIDNPNE